MPKKRARGDRLLEAALEALASSLTEAGAPWMIIGGIAVIARAVRRFTTDIDAAVRGDAISTARLVRVFARHGIVARIAKAVAFAETNLVLLMRHRPTGVDLDVSLAWSGFEHDALEASTMVAFGRVRAPMSTAADLVVFKAIAGRARDMEDVEALLVLFPEIDIAPRIAERVEVGVLRVLPSSTDRPGKAPEDPRADPITDQSEALLAPGTRATTSRPRPTWKPKAAGAQFALCSSAPRSGATPCGLPSMSRPGSGSSAALSIAVVALAWR